MTSKRMKVRTRIPVVSVDEQMVCIGLSKGHVPVSLGEQDRDYASKVFNELLGNSSFVGREVSSVLGSNSVYSHVLSHPQSMAQLQYLNHGPERFAREVVIRSRIESEGKNVIDFSAAQSLFRDCDFRKKYVSALTGAIAQRAGHQYDKKA